MASPTSTFATLRTLHLVIGDALDDIQRLFSQNTDPPSSPPSQCPSPVYPISQRPSPEASPFPTTPPTSFPPTPLSATFPSPRSFTHTDMSTPPLDYPSPDLPYVSDSHSEQLALHPDAVAAASRIVAACGQISSIVHKPFLSLCDLIMSYNLPACMRFVEHLHIAEILREAELNRQRSLTGEQGDPAPCSPAKAYPNVERSRPASNPSTRDLVDVRAPITGMEWMSCFPIHKSIEGLHVTDITSVICSYAGDGYVDPSDLVHVLRLLSTHHIFRETAPDTFALTRVASLLDSGKSVRDVFSNPETKYDDTDGIPAFVALTTDELFKSATYLTEAFTGVQLPTLGSTPNAPFPVNAPEASTNPSTSGYVRNNLASCAPTTRSSSVLTHLVCLEDGDVQPLSHSLPLTESWERVGLPSHPIDTPVSSQLLAAEPRVLLSPRLSPVEASTQAEKRCLRSKDAAKPEKLLAFNLAFHTNTPYFEWLENGGEDLLGGTGQGARTCIATKTESIIKQPAVPGGEPNSAPGKPFRLQRFSKAMMGTAGWEAPKAILSGFDWYSLPKGSTIVDVGGGIGSTTMILARAFNNPRVDSLKRQDGVHSEEPATPRHMVKLPIESSPVIIDEPQNNDVSKDNANLRFVVQDRSVVTALGIEAWRSKCPEMLESGHVVFQDQDFFEPQLPFEPPHLSRHPAVYLLRVVLHDWPDEFARRILINLRVASNPETRLLIAEHVLPLACVDEDVSDNMNTETCERSSTAEWTTNSVLAHIEGAERSLVPPPLLPNLGKASANAYFVDLLMHITLNGKERTLREFCALALSAGWRVTRMSRPEGTLFAYLVCEPISLPDDAQAIFNAVVLSSELSTVVSVPSDEPVHHCHVETSHYKRLPALPLLPSPVLERATSRCGTPTFGSRILLPKDEELQNPRTRGAGIARKWFKSKGLGVRNVMMQKAEKQREEQNLSKSASARDNGDVQNVAPASSSHVRVWWKKSPPNSTSNSITAIHELSGEVHRATGRGHRGTLKSSDSPSTPSPRTSPVHQKWPSIESAVLSTTEASPPVPYPRRPSVASITRKLSFATFRKSSVADITEPLPTPPPSATLTQLAPPPTLHGDTGRSLKHLPSLPTLCRSEVAASTPAGQSAIPRRPSLSFAGHAPLPQSISKSALPRRPDAADASKSGILKSRSSPHASKQSSPSAAESTSVPRRQRRVTLSNSPEARAAGRVNVPVPPGHVGPGVKRIPSVPKLPRRLSIPMLRRKQSQSAIRQDGERD